MVRETKDLSTACDLLTVKLIDFSVQAEATFRFLLLFLFSTLICYTQVCAGIGFHASVSNSEPRNQFACSTTLSCRYRKESECIGHRKNRIDTTRRCALHRGNVFAFLLLLLVKRENFPPPKRVIYSFFASNRNWKGFRTRAR